MYIIVIISTFSCKNSSSKKTSKTKKPNLLYIIVDEMREMAMSCSGDPNIQTPWLDKLAAEGARFTNMYTPNPVCSPARASIYSGHFPHNAGVPRNSYHLRETVKILPEIISDAGYITGHIGKWHLEGADSPFIEKDKQSFKPYQAEWSTDYYGYVPPGNHRGFQYWAGFEHGHQYFGSRYWQKEYKPIYLPEGVYEPDYQTDLAIDFIKNNKDTTWYLDLNFGPPHFPLVAENVKQEDLKHFDPEKLILRKNVPKEFANEAREKLSIYYAMIHNIDENVGKILKVLDQLGLSENTLVIFTSDHGDMMLSHGQNYKRRPQEESTKVPFIIKYPLKIKENSVNSELFTLVDVFPTILDLMDVPKPCNEGISFANELINNKSEKIHTSIYLGCHWFGCRDYDPGLHAKNPWRAVRTKDFMMAFLKINENELMPVQLFDMKNDPYQLNNLIDSLGYNKVKEKHYKELVKWINRTGDSEFMRLTITK